MKADSGTWLYIILSIVFLVISAIGNKNKKKMTSSTEPIDDDYEPTHAPTEKQWPKSFEDVLNDVLDLPKQKEVVLERPYSRPVEVIESQEYQKMEEAQSLETFEPETFSYETPVEAKKIDKPVVYQKMDHPKETIELEKPEVLAVILNNSNFDLKQGIIYSEILNRKYF